METTDKLNAESVTSETQPSITKQQYTKDLYSINKVKENMQYSGKSSTLKPVQNIQPSV